MYNIYTAIIDHRYDGNEPIFVSLLRKDGRDGLSPLFIGSDNIIIIVRNLKTAKDRLHFLSERWSAVEEDIPISIYISCAMCQKSTIDLTNTD